MIRWRRLNPQVSRQTRWEIGATYIYSECLLSNYSRGGKMKGICGRRVFILICTCWINGVVQAQVYYHPGGELKTPAQLTVNWTNIEDNFLNSDSSGRDLNYGSHDGAIAGKAPYGSTYLIRMVNLPELLKYGKVIISCNLHVCLSAADGLSGEKTVGVLRVFKPWIEGNLDGQDPEEGEGSTFNDWSADSMEWAIPGCHNQDDNGVDNEGDGAGADCKATPESTVTVPQTSAFPWISQGFRTWSISPELVTGWYSGEYQNNGLIMKTIAPWGWVHPLTAEAYNIGQRPFFEIEYVDTTSAPGTEGIAPVID